MFQDTQPAALTDNGPDAWAPFRVHQPAEVAALLRQVRDSGSPMVLSSPAGAAIAAELWSLDTDQRRLFFAAPEHDPQLQTLINADEAVAVGYLDSVKLQFDVNNLMLVRGPRSSALQAAMPEVLYRFQRRSAFRVRTLERNSPTARLRHPAIPEMQLALRVIDVSIGGCALFLPHDTPTLEPGVLLHGVAVELDADTRFTATIRIQHVSTIDPQAHGVRLGCEWVSLAHESERALQRCIDQTQKRRRLLSLD